MTPALRRKSRATGPWNLLALTLQMFSRMCISCRLCDIDIFTLSKPGLRKFKELPQSYKAYKCQSQVSMPGVFQFRAHLLPMLKAAFSYLFPRGMFLVSQSYLYFLVQTKFTKTSLDCPIIRGPLFSLENYLPKMEIFHMFVVQYGSH